MAGEALTLIYKELTLTKLKDKYRLYEEVKEGSVQEQIIALPLFLGDGSTGKIDDLEKG